MVVELWSAIDSMQKWSSLSMAISSWFSVMSPQGNEMLSQMRQAWTGMQRGCMYIQLSFDGQHGQKLADDWWLFPALYIVFLSLSPSLLQLITTYATNFITKTQLEALYTHMRVSGRGHNKWAWQIPGFFVFFCRMSTTSGRWIWCVWFSTVCSRSRNLWRGRRTSM